MFVHKFMAADADQNLLINEEELKNSMKDIPFMNVVLEDADLISNLLNDQSGRIDKEAPTINFYEWMFIR